MRWFRISNGFQADLSEGSCLCGSLGRSKDGPAKAAHVILRALNAGAINMQIAIALLTVHTSCSSGRTVDDDLSDFGVATVGKTDSKLIKNVQLRLPDVKQRCIRQTKLKWTSDCDAIVSDLETVSDNVLRVLCYPNGMIEAQCHRWGCDKLT